MKPEKKEIPHNPITYKYTHTHPHHGWKKIMHRTSKTSPLNHITYIYEMQQKTTTFEIHHLYE